MKSSVVVLSTTIALAWQCCQGAQMEEGSEEQFQTETLTLAQCTSAVKKVQETGKYTEEAILPICSSVVRSSKCDFFSEALSLATSHTDFSSKVFCKNIGEAHFCSQTMDRLLSSPIMADLAFGACMRDKSSRGEQYCQRFSKMHAYAVQHDDLDTMRACYMMEAYDDSESEEANSKKPGADSAHTNAAPAKPEANVTLAASTKTKVTSTNSKKASTNSTHTSSASAKPKANGTAAATTTSAPKVTSAKQTSSGKVVAATSVPQQHADVHGHGSTKVHAAVPKLHAASKTDAAAVAVKNASAKKDSNNKRAPMVAKKEQTSLVSSLIHTLSAPVLAVAHAVAKVVLVPPSPHDGEAKNNSGSNAAKTAKAPPKKKNATEAPIASTSKGASLTQAQKVTMKEADTSRGKNVKVVKKATSTTHAVQSKAVAPTFHQAVAQAVAQAAVSSKTHGTKEDVKQHKAALVGKHQQMSSHKIETAKKGAHKMTEKEAKEERDKYGGFLSGFVNL